LAEPNVAVLIDFENVGLDSIQYLLDQVSDVGRVTIKRAYSDWSVQREKRDQLLELGIEAVHHFRSNRSGKNSSDIVLAIDAVDLLYGAPVDTFVIVSSDSDFVPLVSKLRAAGKGVIGSGRHGAASPTLVRSCDRYIYLDEQMPAPRRQGTRSTDVVRAKEDKARIINLADAYKMQAPTLLTRAVESSMDDQGRVVGSKLHQTVQRIDPSFNYKALGYRSFTLYLEASSEVTVDRPRDAGDVVVQLVDGKPASVVATKSAPAEPAPPTVPAPPNWDNEIDAAWSRRRQPRLSGQAARSDAAKVLGVSALGSSPFSSLDKLLAASALLTDRWRRDGNAIISR
jgi:uncharacterized protein (TIGR00288 family)